MGLSQIELARRLGVTPPVIVGLERGANAANINLRLLGRLAEELGLHPVDLFARPPTALPSPGSDQVKIEAALALLGKKAHPADLSRGLKWPLRRTTQALTSLRTACSATGVIVHYSGGRWESRHDDRC